MKFNNNPKLDGLDNIKVFRWWHFLFIIIGLGLVLYSPFILTKGYIATLFKDTGQIGDTIGGITSPLIAIFGAILIFYSFMVQVHANKIMMRFNQKTIAFNKQIEIFNRMTVEHNELNNIRNLINDTIDDFNNFTFRTSSQSIDNIKFKEKNDIRIFILALQKILENNIRGGNSFGDEFLDKFFIDGIQVNTDQIKYLLETVINIFKTIKNSDLYKNENTYCIYSYDKFCRFLDENLLKYYAEFSKIKNKLLPDAISLMKKEKKELKKPEKFLETFSKIIDYLDDLKTNTIKA